MRTLARGTIGTWSSSVQLRILHTERAPARLSLTLAGRVGDGNGHQEWIRCESQPARGPCSESRVSNLRSVLCLSAFLEWCNRGFCGKQRRGGRGTRKLTDSAA